jgi:hypothetical protein
MRKTGDEEIRDDNVDLSDFRNYVDALLEQCHGYVGETSHEDNQAFTSSVLADHWAQDAKACGKALEEMVRADVRVLQKLADSDGDQSKAQ